MKYGSGLCVIDTTPKCVSTLDFESVLVMNYNLIKGFGQSTEPCFQTQC